MSTLVLGAGVIGASIAYELASRGDDVTVLDMRSAGRGASQASAGILAPFTEARPESPLFDLGRQSLSLYDDFIARVRDASGRDVEYARTGTLEVAFDDAEREHLSQSRSWLEAEGQAATWLEPAELRSFEPSLSTEAVAALHIHTHGFVNVPALVTALVLAARYAGAVFEDGVEVISVEPGRDRVSVRTREGRAISADRIVIATGSWSRRIRITGCAPVEVRPIRGQLLHVRAAAAAMPSRIVWGARCYTVPWRDGTLLVGATVEDVGFDESSTVAGVAELTEAASALLPGFAGAAVSAIRVGLRPAAQSGLPAIGPAEGAPGVTLATGHYRNGILLAPLTAKLVADGLIGS